MSTRVKTVLQSGSADCGLACLAMVANALGGRWTVEQLASRFPLSRRGMNLKTMVVCASRMGMAARPLKVELEGLDQLSLPCILHWDMNHFVVLAKVDRRSLTIIDPLVGERVVRISEASEHFTGVALEISSEAEDVPSHEPNSGKSSGLWGLFGRVHGGGRVLFQIFAVALALEAFLVATPLLNQFIIDDVLATHDEGLLRVLIVGFLFVLLIQTTLVFVRSWMIAISGNALVRQWLSRVFTHLLNLPSVWFESRQLGDIASRFAEVYEIQRILTHSAVEAALDGVIGAVALLMMFLYSPPLAGVVLAAVVLNVLVRWIGFGPLRQARLEKIIQKSKESAHFLETIRTIVPLKLFGGEAERRATWQNLLVAFLNRDVRETRLALIFNAIHGLIFGLENLLVLGLGARLILHPPTDGESIFTVGMLLAFVSYKLQFTSRVSGAVEKVVEFRMMTLRLQRLTDILHAEGEADVLSQVPISDLARLPASLELQDVSFRYGEGEPWVLHEVSLRVEPGETVAIVGSSGSGKTTLAKILLGLLSPSSGEVLYGGRRVRELGLGNVRSRLGVVMQEDSLLSGTLLENIAFFDISPDIEHAESCAKAARLHEDIVRMPMGYHTFIGDLGHGLSGGQKQRLLLARALYRRPTILVLDEATSHLDLDNEKAIVEAISALGLTVMLIAHRPETIRRAKRVIRVVSGKLVDDISHLYNPIGRVVAH